MFAFIDRSSCLVEPVLVGRALLLFPVLVQAAPSTSSSRPVAAREYLHREALWKVLCSRDPRSESLSVVVVVVVASQPLQERPCSGRSSPHVVFLQLLTKSSSRATWAFSLNIVVPMCFWRPRIAWLGTVGASGVTESRPRPESCPSRCRWRSQPELLLSPHCDCSSHPFVRGALVQSHSYVHLVLLPPAGLPRVVAARPCRTGATVLQVAVLQLPCHISSNLLELLLGCVVILLQVLHNLSQLRDL